MDGWKNGERGDMHGGRCVREGEREGGKREG